MIVYHGSKEPFDGWNPEMQRSGYYRGFRTTTNRKTAETFGPHIVALLVPEKARFYVVPNEITARALKAQARLQGFGFSQGSGHPESTYLETRGFAGIQRGEEFIIFYPELFERYEP
jgi:hypothetical protein